MIEKSENPAEKDGEVLVSQILALSDKIFRVMKLSIPPEWLTSDMSIAQLRVLLLIHTEGASRVSSIASALGTTLSTASGTVDILAKKGLITRRDDPLDRRLVICELSQLGLEIMNRIWTLSQQQMEKLLRGLSLEELKKAHEVAEILLKNVKTTAVS